MYVEILRPVEAAGGVMLQVGQIVDATDWRPSAIKGLVTMRRIAIVSDPAPTAAPGPATASTPARRSAKG